MHAEDVKAAVRRTGISLRELGRRTNTLGDTLSKCLYVPCPKGNRVIAKYLDRPLHQIWPEWYDRTGDRLPSTQRKTSSARGQRHGQKRAAA